MTKQFISCWLLSCFNLGGCSPLTLSILWDWANRLDHDVSDVLTGVLELVVVEVSWNGGDVLGDIGEVLDNVRGEELDEGNWVLEDLAPLLDSLEVTLHAVAVLEVVWKVLDDLANVTDSGNDVSEVTLLEGLDGVGDLLGNIWGVLDAGLDLWKIFLLEETEDQTIHEVDDVNWGDHWLWNVDRVESLHHF